MSDAPYLKVALATNDLITVDAPFISARQIVFYGVTGSDAQFLGLHQFKGSKPKEAHVHDEQAPAASAPAANSDQGGAKKARCCGSVESAYGGSIEARVNVLDGCSVLFTLGLSDPQAVRVNDLGVFPVKMERPREIDEVLQRLQLLINTNPPMWLVKALKDGPMPLAA